MSSSLFSSFQGNTKCESSFFADTCTLCVPIFLKSRREDYESSPQFRTQMGDGYDFFASVRDGVSIQHAFRLTNLVFVVVVVLVVVLVLVVKSKAP